MPEPLDWLPDGTPYSPRFGDRYHSSAGHGVAQAVGTFLHGCHLPAAWSHQPQWRVLETGFGFGLNFLVTWAAWRADSARPRLLHFVSCEAWPVEANDLLRAASHWAQQSPELAPLAEQLAAQWWGLLPGVHRLSFEQGQVLLTLYIGDAQTLLRQHKPQVDSVYLDGFNPASNPNVWNMHTLKAVARCCQRGTRLATWSVARSVRDALAQCGFVVHKVAGVPPKLHNLHAVFDPHWQPRPSMPTLPDVAIPQAGRCCIIGSGLAGATAAASLARRGWQVQVLEQASAPAAGASGLPAGLFAPHTSPDDCVLSRLSRAGVRAMLQLLDEVASDARGSDWSDCGVLEHCTTGHSALPWGEGNGLDWSRPATAAECAANHLPEHAAARWHVRGGWVRPARLIQRLLALPSIAWQGGQHVAQLQRMQGGQWRALDAQGRSLAEADLVIVCAGPHSHAVLARALPLQPVRGQVAWGLHAAEPSMLPWPVQPLNGHGNLVPHAPLDDGPGWVLGATFERDCTALPPSSEDVAAGQAANFAKLRLLAPRLSLTPHAHHWAAVRCATPDRLPMIGPVDVGQPGLWVYSGLGARGLTLSALCAELLAARLHAEPLPLAAPLAQALRSERYLR